MTHNDGGGGSGDGTELAAELANPVNIRSNMTELLVLRTQLTAQYAASVAQELIDGKFELNVAMEMEISVLETTFAVKIPPLTVYASTPSDDFRGSYEGAPSNGGTAPAPTASAPSPPQTLDNQSVDGVEIARSIVTGQCTCVYRCDTPRGDMLAPPPLPVGANPRLQPPPSSPPPPPPPSPPPQGLGDAIKDIIPCIPNPFIACSSPSPPPPPPGENPVPQPPPAKPRPPPPPPPGLLDTIGGWLG